MDDTKKALEKMMQLWSDGVRAAAEASQSFFQAATPGSLATDIATDPAKAVGDVADTLGKAAAAFAGIQSQLVQQWLTDLPTVGQQRLNAQTFSQLGRMVQANWRKEMERFAEIPKAVAGRLQQADPSRLGKLFETMMAEYARDMKTLESANLKLDYRPLAEAWGKVVSGHADEDARKLVDRFVEALSVKARYGAEYYADPEKTPVGLTPREKVHEAGQAILYRYQAPEGVERRDAPPVLLVYSMINKSYILDLMPGYSFVEYLLAQGLDVYLVEWQEARPSDRNTSLDDYIDPGIHGCVQAIGEQTGADKVSLFGHCIGGNLALMYAALYPDKVDRMVTLTTPVTTADGGVVAVWTDRAVFPVEEIVDSYGLMPAKLIRYTFMALKPYYEVMKWQMFIEFLGNDQVMALWNPVDRWANENVDVPGEVFRKFVHEVFHSDRFRSGQTKINDRQVDLKNINCPLMNLAATQDWVVPMESARLLNDLVGSNRKEFVAIDGTHVSIMIEPRTYPIWGLMKDFLLADHPAKS